eukprot:gnl/MRDRNA2_/MRDRNA2_174676_c0_seq1.p1 gnl/MRDRNA2_/MRDRNA2_174676_c0~~gnl/MRDRNA2_/MRDRNA2_174676_c0_seq1.p1  ORF type:complete len:269 (+),score=31.13 gnl/MRDRNA2_/MRDRNA2_174676_c0_seq1:76-882(+)
MSESMVRFVLLLMGSSLDALRLAANKPKLSAKTVQHKCPPQTVFGVGLPRTGTASTSVYLSILGYNSHHIIKIEYAAVESCKSGKGSCDFYDKFGAGDPSKSVAFEDVPTFGLSCSLAKKYPNAKFVTTVRPFDDYARSVRAMVCHQIPDKCANLEATDYLKNQELLYGRVYSKFCQHVQKRSDVCDGEGKTDGAAQAWHETGLTEEFRKIQDHHDAEVKTCVPEGQLLELKLGDETNPNKIFNFLGCTGDIPKFPHEHNDHFNSASL